MKQFILRVLILVLVLLPFMSTEASRRNHLIKRYNGAQLEELIITLNQLSRPIPFNYNKK